MSKRIFFNHSLDFNYKQDPLWLELHSLPEGIACVNLQNKKEVSIFKDVSNMEVLQEIYPDLVIYTSDTDPTDIHIKWVVLTPEGNGYDMIHY